MNNSITFNSLLLYKSISNSLVTLKLSTRIIIQFNLVVIQFQNDLCYTNNGLI